MIKIIDTKTAGTKIGVVKIASGTTGSFYPPITLDDNILSAIPGSQTLGMPVTGSLFKGLSAARNVYQNLVVYNPGKATRTFTTFAFGSGGNLFFNINDAPAAQQALFGKFPVKSALPLGYIKNDVDLGIISLSAINPGTYKFLYSASGGVVNSGTQTLSVIVTDSTEVYSPSWNLTNSIQISSASVPLEIFELQTYRKSFTDFDDVVCVYKSKKVPTLSTYSTIQAYTSSVPNLAGNNYFVLSKNYNASGLSAFNWKLYHNIDSYNISRFALSGEQHTPRTRSVDATYGALLYTLSSANPFSISNLQTGSKVVTQFNAQNGQTLAVLSGYPGIPVISNEDITVTNESGVLTFSISATNMESTYTNRVSLANRYNISVKNKDQFSPTSYSGLFCNPQTGFVFGGYSKTQGIVSVTLEARNNFGVATKEIYILVGTSTEVKNAEDIFNTSSNYISTAVLSGAKTYTFISSTTSLPLYTDKPFSTSVNLPYYNSRIQNSVTQNNLAKQYQIAKELNLNYRPEQNVLLRSKLRGEDAYINALLETTNEVEVLQDRFASLVLVVQLSGFYYGWSDPGRSTIFVTPEPPIGRVRTTLYNVASADPIVDNPGNYSPINKFYWANEYKTRTNIDSSGFERPSVRIVGDPNGIGFFGSLSSRAFWGIEYESRFNPLYSWMQVPSQFDSATQPQGYNSGLQIQAPYYRYICLSAGDTSGTYGLPRTGWFRLSSSVQYINTVLDYYGACDIREHPLTNITGPGGAYSTYYWDNSAIRLVPADTEINNMLKVYYAVKTDSGYSVNNDGDLKDGWPESTAAIPYFLNEYTIIEGPIKSYDFNNFTTYYNTASQYVSSYVVNNPAINYGTDLFLPHVNVARLYALGYM